MKSRGCHGNLASYRPEGAKVRLKLSSLFRWPYQSLSNCATHMHTCLHMHSLNSSYIQINTTDKRMQAPPILLIPLQASSFISSRKKKKQKEKKMIVTAARRVYTHLNLNPL